MDVQDVSSLELGVLMDVQDVSSLELGVLMDVQYVSSLELGVLMDMQRVSSLELGILTCMQSVSSLELEVFTLAKALQYAAQKGYVPEMILLMENGARVNQQISKGPQKGKTALHLACIFNEMEVAKLLLNYGADPTIKDKVCIFN